MADAADLAADIYLQKIQENLRDGLPHTELGGADYIWAMLSADKMGGSIMGRKVISILATMCILILAGCGSQGNAEKAAEVNSTAQENTIWTEEPEDANRTEEPWNGDSQAAEEENIESAEEETASSLTAEQIEDAKQAALAYYKGTVFSVNSIVYLNGKLPYGDTEGNCNFIVNVSKDGVVQEPDRTISLQLDQDGWKVVNEGY